MPDLVITIGYVGAPRQHAAVIPDPVLHALTRQGIEQVALARIKDLLPLLMDEHGEPLGTR